MAVQWLIVPSRMDFDCINGVWDDTMWKEQHIDGIGPAHCGSLDNVDLGNE
jgi:hypothetical protein